MLFDQYVIDLMENNPIEGISKACDIIISKQEELASNRWNEKQHDMLWEGATFVNMAIKAHALSIKTEFPKKSNKMIINCSQLSSYIDDVSSTLKSKLLQLKIESYENQYKPYFKNISTYEFSQKNLERIQVLLNEIRKQITDNKQLNNEHKQRLLKRLEKLQSELHKKVSDVDRLWGLIADASAVLGKLGENTKPIIDRLKEIAEITWQTQARMEKLPSNLTNPVIEDMVNKPNK